MAIQPPEIKVPLKFAPTEFLQANPSMLDKPFFSFQYLHPVRHVRELMQSQQAELVKQLCALSERTWQQLWDAPHGGVGCERIRQELNFKWPAALAGQTVLAFKYCGKLSMVGFRDKNVFHIVGIDKDFKNNSCYGH
jgi:hypothetical protein